ncbi:MAG: hypothetical protein EXS31_15545 [Pedosphaera sp.]|nr:hypothetical protein [Pedosphaera sp.]
MITLNKPMWKAHFQAAILMAPALLIWVIGGIFVFPKLKQILADTGADLPLTVSALRVSDFFMQNGIWIALSAILSLVLLEWRVSLWPRCRSVCLSVVIFCVNTSVLLLLSFLLVSLLMVIPDLIRK